MHHATSRHLAAILAAMLLTGCSGAVKTVTLKGKVRPPSSEGISSPPANPPVANSPLLVSNLSGTLAKAAAARVGSAGEYSFDLRTDGLPAGGDFVKVAWPHPTRGGILLERTFSLSKDQTGEIQGDLSDLSTLVTLGLESLRQTDPGRTVAPPPLLENDLAQATYMRSRFQSRYFGYLSGSETAPGADADLAQESAAFLFN